MSCTFWILRRKRAANMAACEKMNEAATEPANAAEPTEATKSTEPIESGEEKSSGKKSAKKGGDTL